MSCVVSYCAYAETHENDSTNCVTEAGDSWDRSRYARHSVGAKDRYPFRSYKPIDQSDVGRSVAYKIINKNRFGNVLASRPGGCWSPRIRLSQESEYGMQPIEC